MLTVVVAAFPFCCLSFAFGHGRARLRSCATEQGEGRVNGVGMEATVFASPVGSVVVTAVVALLVLALLENGCV